jgi:hypothetical protein
VGGAGAGVSGVRDGVRVWSAVAHYILRETRSESSNRE